MLTFKFRARNTDSEIRSMDDLRIFKVFLVLETILYIFLGLGAISSAWRGLEIRNWLAGTCMMLAVSFAFRMMAPTLLSSEATETIRSEDRQTTAQNVKGRAN